MALSLHSPTPSLPSPCAWCTPTPPPTPPHLHFAPILSNHLPPSSLTRLYVLLHGLWPRRPAWHWSSTPQDHSGTLGAEEFKACLISLGFDIANDAQVLNRSPSTAVRSLTGFFFSFFCTSPPTFLLLSLLPLPLSKCSMGFSTLPEFYSSLILNPSNGFPLLLLPLLLCISSFLLVLFVHR